jgi:hypothetical protein
MGQGRVERKYWGVNKNEAQKTPTGEGYMYISKHI